MKLEPLSDESIEEITSRLAMEYPLLDFSFQDGYADELKLIWEASQEDTVRQIVRSIQVVIDSEWLDDVKFGMIKLYQNGLKELGGKNEMPISKSNTSR